MLAMKGANCCQLILVFCIAAFPARAVETTADATCRKSSDGLCVKQRQNKAATSEAATSSKGAAYLQDGSRRMDLALRPQEFDNSTEDEKTCQTICDKFEHDKELGLIGEMTEEAAKLTTRMLAGVKVFTHEERLELDESAVEGWMIGLPANFDCTQVHSFLQNTPSGVTGVFEACKVHIVKVLATLQGLQEELQTHPGALYSERDVKMYAAPEVPGQDNGTSLLETKQTPYSWGTDRVDDRTGLDQSYLPPGNMKGQGVHIYIADTGIRFSHSEFGGRASAAIDVTSNSLVECGGSTDVSCGYDLQGHGTHCAGSAAGTNLGVAPMATLHSAKVLDDSGSGDFSWLVHALDWIIEKGQRPAVVSASLGGPGQIPAVDQAITAAHNAGITVVIAAGNDNSDACQYSPSFSANAITVGATSPPMLPNSPTDQRAWYSNWGSCLDIYAPGTNIISASHTDDNGQLTLSGTSMACPHVSGAAALLLAQGLPQGAATSQQVTDRLKLRATPGTISDPRAGSPNIMLYTGFDNPTPPPTPPTPAPAPTDPPTQPNGVPSPMPGCEIYCTGTCPCLIKEAERCQLKTCSGCSFCPNR